MAGACGNERCAIEMTVDPIRNRLINRTFPHKGQLVAQFTAGLCHARARERVPLSLLPELTYHK